MLVDGLAGRGFGEQGRDRFDVGDGSRGWGLAVSGGCQGKSARCRRSILTAAVDSEAPAMLQR